MPRIPNLHEERDFKIISRKVDKEKGWNEQWRQIWWCSNCKREGHVDFRRLECAAHHVYELIAREHHRVTSGLCHGRLHAGVGSKYLFKTGL